MLQHEILALSPGTEEKFVAAESAMLAKIQSTSPVDLQAMTTAVDEEEQSRLLQMADSVGIISIHGGLTNSDSFLNQFFGLISYNEIRTAAVEALEFGAKTILFDIDSPGGRVNGMADLGSFISSIQVPTISFTNGAMASASYFLASQADKVFADSFAEVGSVGVIVKMYDRSEMLKQVGVKPVRFRSGDLKASGDGDFKLSAKEKEYIQDKVNTFAGKFFDIVSDARGLTLPVMEKLGIMSGRTFIGEEAVAAQLVDSMKTFDEAMLQAYSLANKVIDKESKAKLPLY